MTRRWPTPTYQLAELLMGEKVEKLIRKMRRQGYSYEEIAREIWRRTDHQVSVTKQAVMGWAAHLGIVDAA